MTKIVMIVEDEFFVALELQDIVEESGCRADGPYATVQETLDALEEAIPVCAILDVQLKDGEVFPVADRLREEGVPIIFHSGHADETALFSRYPGALVCGKPCSPSTLRAAIERMLEEGD